MKRQPYRPYYLVAPIILFTAAVLTPFIGSPFVAWRNSQLSKALTAQQPGTTVTLEELVPFTWDSVYTFTPYTTREEMGKVIGKDSSDFVGTVNEGMAQLVFVHGVKVVASVCRYPADLGWQVILGDAPEKPEQKYVRVQNGQNIPFAVTQEDGYLLFTAQPEGA